MNTLLEFDEIVEIDKFFLNEKENFKFVFEDELEEFKNKLNEGLSPALAKKLANTLKKISKKKVKMLTALKGKGNKKIAKLKAAGKHEEAKKVKVTMNRKKDEIQDQAIELEQTARNRMQKAREKADKYNN